MRVALAVIASMFVVPAAEAACHITQSSLQGAWDMYLPFEPASPCRVKLLPQGSMKEATCEGQRPAYFKLSFYLIVPSCQVVITYNVGQSQNDLVSVRAQATRLMMVGTGSLKNNRSQPFTAHRVADVP